jgi:hypothetical protein
VEVADGVATFVYAWGSLEDGNLALATQTIEGLHSAPNGVPTGQVQVTEEAGMFPAAWAGLALALGTAGVLGARRLAVARQR